MQPRRRSDDNDDGDDQTVQADSLSEDHDEDHTDEDAISLGVGSDTSVTGDANSKTSSEGRETASEAGSEVLVASSLLEASLGHVGVDDNSNNDAVDTQNTRHDNGDESLEHLLAVDNRQGGDADTSLGGTVGGTEVAEHQGGGDAEVAEEVG